MTRASLRVFDWSLLDICILDKILEIFSLPRRYSLARGFGALNVSFTKSIGWSVINVHIQTKLGWAYFLSADADLRLMNQCDITIMLMSRVLRLSLHEVNHHSVASLV